MITYFFLISLFCWQFHVLGGGFETSYLCAAGLSSRMNHFACLCFLWLSEQTAVVPLCTVSSEVYITEAECVLMRSTVQGNLIL